MKGKAAILVETGKPLAFEDVEVPALEYGQVLVKVLCSGICGSQIGEIDAVKGPDPHLPHLLGHEGCGTVLDCCAGVTTVSEGDRVVMHWRKGAGIQSRTPEYNSRLGAIHAGWVTTFNEYAVVSENRLTRIPSDFDPESAALMGCAVTTGFGVINNDARLRIGESIAVLGCGGVGLSVIQGASLVAAHPIIACSRFEAKLALARKLGATHWIRTEGGGVREAIAQIVGPQGVDVAVETSGRAGNIEQAFDIAGPSGRVILVGVPRAGEQASLYTLPLHFDKKLTGSHGGDARPELDIPRYIALCETGKLDLRRLIGKRYTLNEINKAIADMRESKVAGRCMIHVSQD